MSEIHYNSDNGDLPLAQEREAVKKGAKLLDKILPGWHNEVSLGRLDMCQGTTCMMGQLFGTGVESQLAEKMYPEELRKARAEYAGSDYNLEEVEDGFGVAGTFRSPGKSLIGKLMRKVGLKPESKASLAKLKALQHVCAGHDNKCLWAEEIATRRAMERQDDKTRKRAKA